MTNVLIDQNCKWLVNEDSKKFLEHYDQVFVVGVNATIMIGLLILLTFQLVATTTTGDEIRDLFNQKKDATLERDSLNLAIRENCELDPFENYMKIKFESGSHCFEWQKQYLLLGAKIDQMNATMYQKSASRDYRFESWVPVVIIIGQVSANFLIIPFAFSATIEIIKSTRREGFDNKASKIGLVSMEIGFILLAIVLSFNAVIDSIGIIIWS